MQAGALDSYSVVFWLLLSVCCVVVVVVVVVVVPFPSAFCSLILKQSQTIHSPCALYSI